jgi:hypothetical protein
MGYRLTSSGITSETTDRPFQRSIGTPVTTEDRL